MRTITTYRKSGRLFILRVFAIYQQSFSVRKTRQKNVMRSFFLSVTILDEIHAITLSNG
jgi:CRISPR/Cas system-associated endonuclease/helicase Cas3